MIQNYEQITYKNKVIDTGYIIGGRKWRWLLKRKYEPCWAKNSHFISLLSPHKENFQVYIPKSELLNCIGQKVTIQQNKVRTEIKVTIVNDNFFEYDLINEVKECQTSEPSTTAGMLDPEVGF